VNVFVYGTLKRNQRLAWVMDKSEFLGPAMTLRRDFDMLSCGHFPAVVPGTFRILGEVYRVNEKTLKQLDFIERVPQFYQRRKVPLVEFEPSFIYIATPDLAEDLRQEQDILPVSKQIRTDIQARTKEWVWNR
jgi:gamma-glutamylcyclotransferase (GGCT)/AIG2-like uncharacterized protein YtfP